MSCKCAIFNNQFCSAIDFRMSPHYSAIWAVWNCMKLFQKMLHLHFRNESKKIIFPLLHATRGITARSLLFKGPVSKMPCYSLPNITEICLTLACKSLVLLRYLTLTDFSTFNLQINNLTFIFAVEAKSRVTVKRTLPWWNFRMSALYCSVGYVGQTLCSCGPIPASGWGICLSQHLQATLWDQDAGRSSTVTKQPTSVTRTQATAALL